jgi:hypothetical protein
MDNIIEIIIGKGHDSNLQKAVMKTIKENNGTCKITLRDLDFTMADVELYGGTLQLDFDVWLGASVKGEEKIVERFQKEVGDALLEIENSENSGTP